MKRRMWKLLNSIEKNGRAVTSKKLIAMFCIEEGISKLTERHRNFSERTRMSADGLMIAMRVSELQWVLEP